MTFEWWAEVADMLISIHTPTQGVTFAVVFSDWVEQDFNPHSHAGSDGLTIIPPPFFFLISIHTPTQGVTKFNV